MLARYGTESKEIGKERHWSSARIQLVAVANLRVPISLCGIGKLKWYVTIKRLKPSWPVAKHFVSKRLSH